MQIVGVFKGSINHKQDKSPSWRAIFQALLIHSFAKNIIDSENFMYKCYKETQYRNFLIVIRSKLKFLYVMHGKHFP